MAATFIFLALHFCGETIRSKKLEYGWLAFLTLGLA